MNAVVPTHDVDQILAAFAAAVRAAGAPVTMDRTATFLEGCGIAGAADRAGVYWTGRATLCGSLEDLDRYDSVFHAWFGGSELAKGASRDSLPRTAHADLTDTGGDSDDEQPAIVRASASATEVLRHRDVATLSPAERAELTRMFGRLRFVSPVRTSARRSRSRAGEIDARSTLRDSLRRGGEPARLRFRRRTTRPRRVVVLLDVSGSMGPYADSLLRWTHVIVTASPRRTEVFTIGTRLTRVSGALRVRNGENALQAAGSAVPDWSGGTRLGEALRVFNDRHGQRGLARGAVVVILSDGWERGDCTLLSEQMRRLNRLAHKVVWINPHLGKAGYAPVQTGIVAALPFVDFFLAGHSMATFERALEVIADA
jgi:uncharacterized protein with von Willebrand factor type A (vWA) domain